jgi:Peptidase A4 family
MAMLASPSVRCILHSLDDQAFSLPLYADDRGIVRFTLWEPTVGAMRLQLDRTSDTGAPLPSQTVDASAMVAPETGYSPAIPSRIQQLSVGTQRAPLAGNPMSWSQRDLVHNGYSPRPDPTVSPDDYEQWLNDAKLPMKIVHSGGIRDVDQRRHSVAPQMSSQGIRPAGACQFAPHDSQVWSGPIIDMPTYVMAGGWWNVPSITSHGFDPLIPSLDVSYLWAGIDGGVNGLLVGASTDVMQVGTQQVVQESYCHPNHAVSCYATGYAGWYEWYPGALFIIPNVVVNPGDRIESIVWSGDSWGNFSVTGGYMYFSFFDYTTGLTMQDCIGPQNSSCVKKVDTVGQVFKGDTAEWIMERPSTADHMSNYGTAQITSARAFATYDGESVAHTFNTDSTFNDRLVDLSSCDVLSTTQPQAGTQTINFTWQNYQ